MDSGTLLLIGIGIVVIIVVLVILDMVFTGGAGTMGMMHGTAMTPALATSASAGASVVLGGWLRRRV